VGCEAQEGKYGRNCEWEWRKRWVFGVCGGQRAAPELMVRHKVDPGRAAHRILRSVQRTKRKKRVSGTEQKLVLSKKRKWRKRGGNSWLRTPRTCMIKSNHLFSFPSRKLKRGWTGCHFSFRDPPERSACQRSDKMARGRRNEAKGTGLRAWEWDGQDRRRHRTT